MNQKTKIILTLLLFIFVFDLNNSLIITDLNSCTNEKKERKLMFKQLCMTFENLKQCFYFSQKISQDLSKVTNPKLTINLDIEKAKNYTIKSILTTNRPIAISNNLEVHNKFTDFLTLIYKIFKIEFPLPYHEGIILEITAEGSETSIKYVAIHRILSGIVVSEIFDTSDEAMRFLFQDRAELIVDKDHTNIFHKIIKEKNLTAENFCIKNRGEKNEYFCHYKDTTKQFPIENCFESYKYTFNQQIFNLNRFFNLLGSINIGIYRPKSNNCQNIVATICSKVLEEAKKYENINMVKINFAYQDKGDCKNE